MRRLAAVGIALAIAAGSAAAAFAVGGVAGLPSELLRSEYPGYDEVASWEFMSGEYDALAEAGASPELVLGSSELKPGPAGPAHPAAMFSDGRFGATSVIAGRAGVNDLWQAIELGALAPHLPEGSRRAVVFVSMQWFMCYRDPQSSFPGVFSQGAYDAFMANGSIPDDVKRRVAARAEEYGALGSGGSDACPLARATSAVDRVARERVDDLRIAWRLRSNGEAEAPGEDGAAAGGSEPCPDDLPETASGEPDWEEIVAAARERAVEASSSNDLGLYDAWYEKKYDAWLSGAQSSWKIGEEGYFSEQELEDFELMLEVCRATGVEPLVVIQPVKGAVYDQTAYTRDVRARYYDMVRSACARAGVRTADFSDREYDPLFLRDYSHPSDYGAALYSQALYGFWRG